MEISSEQRGHWPEKSMEATRSMQRLKPWETISPEFLSNWIKLLSGLLISPIFYSDFYTHQNLQVKKICQRLKATMGKPTDFFTPSFSDKRGENNPSDEDKISGQKRISSDSPYPHHFIHTHIHIYNMHTT